MYFEVYMKACLYRGGEGEEICEQGLSRITMRAKPPATMVELESYNNNNNNNNNNNVGEPWCGKGVAFGPKLFTHQIYDRFLLLDLDFSRAGRSLICVI